MLGLLWERLCCASENDMLLFRVLVAPLTVSERRF
jgi:hypothetical protein